MEAVERRVVVKKEEKKKPSAAAPSTGSASPVAIMHQKLGLGDQEIRRSKLYSFINEWYGIPYAYGGCQKSGIDCSCFTSILYEKVYGITLSRTAGDMFTACDKVSGEEMREGDIVFFKINGNRISHVGVYTRNDFFVHASTSKGVMLSSMNEAYYKKYFFCAGRLKKL